MTTAPPQTVRYPRQTLAGLTGTLEQLIQLGVTVQYTHNPGAAISRYDGRSKTLTIRADTCLEDQVWTLSQAWLHIAIGPWASQAHEVPTLRLVPSQREPLHDAV